MLRLKNIEKNSDTITAYYDPENTGQLGFIKLDVTTAEVLESQVSDYDKDFPRYYNHARKALAKMAGAENQPPTEKIVMWH